MEMWAPTLYRLLSVAYWLHVEPRPAAVQEMTMAERKSARGKKKAAAGRGKSRTSTRPRSSRAIAQRSTEKSRKSRAQREPKVSRTRTRASLPEPSSLRTKARATVLVIGMASLGFFGVLAVDTVGRIQDTMATIEFGEVWSKLKKRLLDDDVPGTKKKAPAAKKTVRKAPKAAQPVAPALPSIRSKRADVGVPSPEAYAKATRGAVESRRKESAAEAKARLDSIIDSAL